MEYNGLTTPLVVIDTKAGKLAPSIDATYGPYANLDSAFTEISTEFGAEGIPVGLTVGIESGNVISEYWFNGGTTRNHLVKKGSDSSTDEIFSTVNHISGIFTIDADIFPYTIINLDSTLQGYGLLNITGNNGAHGKIIVNQGGAVVLELGANITGNVILPNSPNTSAMINYNIINSIVYLYDSTIVYDTIYPNPQKISDFVMQYFDSSTISFQWTAPYANTTLDSVTYYDMRYSNSEIDSNNLVEWNSISKVDDLPTPLTPGTLQSITINELRSNTYYYFYIKGVKVNEGTAYISESSPTIVIRTLGSTDLSKAYRIPINVSMLHPQDMNCVSDKDDNGMAIKLYPIDNLVDEISTNQYLADGYPDTTNKSYSTYWSEYKYSRDASPFFLDIDLLNQYTMDRLYIYTAGKIMPGVTIYYMEDWGSKWKKAGIIKVEFKAWGWLEFSQDIKARFLRIAWDQMDFGSTSNDPNMSTIGMERFPDPENNGTLDTIHNMLVYGRAVTTVPDGITYPRRRSIAIRSADEFFCSNGHFYQQGRLHHYVSGALLRLYGAGGHFMPKSKEVVHEWGNILWKPSNVPWVMANNGTGNNLETTLRKTFARYGLKPYISSTSNIDICAYSPTLGEDSSFMFSMNGSQYNKTKPDGLYYKAKNNSRPLDNYWTTLPYQPRPARGIGGLDAYYAITKDSTNYKTYAYWGYNLAAKYGSVAVDPLTVAYEPDENLTLGTDLLCGLEWGNEPDQNWSGWYGWTSGEEHAALDSAIGDAHAGTLSIPLENRPIGMKAADPNFLNIAAGCASVNAGYFQQAVLWNKAHRSDRRAGFDVWCVHRYCSNVGNQGSSTAKIQYGIPWYNSIMGTEQGRDLLKIVDFRDRVTPSTELWVNEWGYGESGARNSRSKYQCYSYPGKTIHNWTIPDRHRSETKGAWIIRATIWMMEQGVNLCNYYSTENNEASWFGTGQYDAGQGFEMWEWNKLTDMTPGKKYEAIATHEVGYDRGGFATSGLFGQIFANGAYPITNSAWYVMTFRNRLKNYIYIGFKDIEQDSKIKVACFKHKDSDKGAYVVWYEDSNNNGIANVQIPLPAGLISATNVSVYLPKLTDPRTVPSTIGFDQPRTGLPTARHETYTNGAWVLSNQPIYTPGSGPVYGTLAQGAAVYPDIPKEGDEIVILPTKLENPYFPIVGPVHANYSTHGLNLGAQNYEQESTTPGVWESKQNIALAWRQVEAICDYIDYTEEGKKGSRGIESSALVLNGSIVANVTEYPEYYFFNASPQPTYHSKVQNISAVAINTETIHLYWNNSNASDTGYKILMSNLPETGFTLKETISAGVENKYVAAGLHENTAYYFKVIPLLGDIDGDISNYATATTFSFIDAPENLIVQHRASSSITLQWDYNVVTSSEFVYYGIYRGLSNGVFSLVGTVDDLGIHTYKDVGLVSGTPYYYRVRIIGLSGSSEYTPTLETRTLTTEEASPIVKDIKTNKEGSKINITFDLPLSTTTIPAVASFTLTEDGISRAITSIKVDSGNPAILSLTIPTASLADYDKLTNTRLSYTKDILLTSVFGVVVDSFSEFKVINNTNNFTNIENQIWLNLSKEGELIPTDTRWNNLFTSKLTNYTLKNTTNKELTAKISTIDKKNLSFGDLSGGICDIPEIEKSVYGVGWTPPFEATITENKYGRIILSGLNTTSKYSFVGFGGATQTNSDRIAKLKASGSGDPIYSAEVNQKLNYNATMIVEDIKPNANGIIYLDLIFCTTADRDTNYPKLAYVQITEFSQNEDPENRDVSIRGVTSSADEYGTTVPTITISLNLLGVGTHYRIGQTADISISPWIQLPSQYTFQHVLDISSGYGAKLLNIQVKNLYNQSDVVTKSIVYKNSTIPLNLKNIVINSGAIETPNTVVQVAFAYEGTNPPTHYAIKESVDIVDADFKSWTTNPVSFTLSSSFGAKTVYARLKNIAGEISDIAQSTITLTNSNIPITSMTLVCANKVNVGQTIPVTLTCLPTNNTQMSEVWFNVDVGSDLAISNTRIEGNIIKAEATGLEVGIPELSGRLSNSGVIMFSNAIDITVSDSTATRGYFDELPKNADSVLSPTGLVSLGTAAAPLNRHFSITGDSTEFELANQCLINGRVSTTGTVDFSTISWPIDGSEDRSVRYPRDKGFSEKSFSLEIDFYGNIDNASIITTIPACKYNKKLTFILSQDDGKCTTFSQLWSRWNGRWTSKDRYYHVGLTKNRWHGETPAHTMASTNGCGKEVRWNFSSCVYMSILDSNPSWTQPSILWNDIRETLTLPHSVDYGFHNVDETVYDKTDKMSIINGFGNEAQTFYAGTGYVIDTLAVPDGNNVYIEAGKIDNSIKFIRRTSGNGDPLLNLYTISKDIYKYDCNLLLSFTNENYNEVLPKLAIMNTQSQPDVCTIGTHELDWAWSPIFETMYSTYGLPGLDNIWVTSYKEMAEYTYVRQNATIHSEVLDLYTGKIDLTIKELPYSDYHECTLLVNVLGTTSGQEPTIEYITLPNTIYGISDRWDKASETIIVNINWDPKLVTQAETFVAKYETSGLWGDRVDAIYHVNKLRPSLQTPFTTRITQKDVLTGPIFITKVELEGDDEFGTGLLNFYIDVWYETTDGLPRTFTSYNIETIGPGGTGMNTIDITNIPSEKKVRYTFHNAAITNAVQDSPSYTFNMQINIRSSADMVTSYIIPYRYKVWKTYTGSAGIMFCPGQVWETTGELGSVYKCGATLSSFELRNVELLTVPLFNISDGTQIGTATASQKIAAIQVYQASIATGDNSDIVPDFCFKPVRPGIIRTSGDVIDHTITFTLPAGQYTISQFFSSASAGDDTLLKQHIKYILPVNGIRHNVEYLETGAIHNNRDKWSTKDITITIGSSNPSFKYVCELSPNNTEYWPALFIRKI